MNERKKKILVVSNMYPSEMYPSYGTFVRNFCRELEELSIKYDKVVLTKGKLPSIINYIIYYLKVILTIVLKRYDIVYVHYASHSSIPLLIAKKIKNVKIYTNVHGGDIIPNTDTQTKMLKYTKALLKKSSKVIVPSLYFKEVVNQKYSIDLNKIAVYPSGGVNRSVFNPQIKTFDENSKVIGFVGRIEKGKGWHIFVKAINALKQNYNKPSLKVLIIGNGVEYEKLLKVLDNYELTGITTLVKSVTQSELSNYYNQMDVFCLPTEAKESLGLVVLEALACKVPVVVSDSGAPKYYVKDNFNGFVVEKGNEFKIAMKITEILEMNEKDLNILKENSLKTARPYFTENVRVDLKKILTEE